jgi:hypothetical protein
MHTIHVTEEYNGIYGGLLRAGWIWSHAPGF